MSESNPGTLLILRKTYYHEGNVFIEEKYAPIPHKELCQLVHYPAQPFLVYPDKERELPPDETIIT